MNTTDIYYKFLKLGKFSAVYCCILRIFIFVLKFLSEFKMAVTTSSLYGPKQRHEKEDSFA